MPTGLELQSVSLASLPEHCTLSRTMDPVPWPKKAFEKACEPVGKVYKLVLC